MIRKIAGTTAAAALSIVIAASSAGAAPGSYYPDGYRQATPGTGTATAEISTDAFGRMSADSAATGGTKKGLIGNKTRPSTATAEASVSEGFGVTEGTYRVTVTYSGVAAGEAAVGNGTASTEAATTATFSSRDGQGLVLGATETDLDAAASTLTQTFTVEVSKTGTLGIQGEIRAVASAKGTGNSASAQASTTGVTFTVAKVG